MALQLERISVKRFKQLEDFDLELNDATVLIGANNAGKSSALQALHFAVSIAQTAKLVGEGVNWGADKFKVSFNPSQLLYTPVADVLSLAYGGQLQEPASSQIEIELVANDGSKCVVALRRGRNRNIAVVLEGRILGERLMSFDQPFTVYAPGLAGISKEERHLSPGVVRRIVARGDANLVLRNVMLMLKEASDVEIKKRKPITSESTSQSTTHVAWKSIWQRFQDGMCDLFPGIEFEIKFDRDRDEHIEVFFKRPDKPRLPIDAAGTSILQASQILAYIILFSPRVLILDEPDSHLHPNNQRALCNLVVDLAAKHKFRALISTHSRHVLDALREQGTIVWVSNGTKIKYDSVSTASMLMELGALDSIDYFASGTTRCLFATEDSSTESLQALDALLRSNGFNMGETDIRAYSGCTKIDSAKVLRGFLLDKAGQVQFVLHRDRDYMDEASADKFEKEIQSIKAHPFLTDLNDAEAYFLNAQHISFVNPRISHPRAQELIDDATRNAKEKSIEVITNIRFDAAQRDRKGGKSPNPGAIAAQARSDFESDPAKWRRGKPTANALKQLLQKELGGHPVINQSSPYLKVPALAKIGSMIWPMSTAEMQRINRKRLLAQLSRLLHLHAIKKAAHT